MDGNRASPREPVASQYVPPGLARSFIAELTKRAGPLSALPADRNCRFEWTVDYDASSARRMASRNA
jgi:hypothetical protein